MQWQETAADWNGKRNYTSRVRCGEFHISPIKTPSGRHLGYTCQFANTGNAGSELPTRNHANLPSSGLWHSVGPAGIWQPLHETHIFGSPQMAKSAAKRFVERYCS